MTRITAIERTATGWLYTVDRDPFDEEPYRAWDVRGDLVGEFDTDTFEIETTAQSPPLVTVEVLGDIVFAPESLGSLVAGTTVVLQWLDVGAEAYAVQQQINGQWEPRATVFSQNELYHSVAFADAFGDFVVDSWRVIAVEPDGITPAATGQPVAFDVAVIGLPAPPTVTVRYDDGNVIVDARTDGGFPDGF